MERKKTKSVAIFFHSVLCFMNYDFHFRFYMTFIYITTNSKCSRALLPSAITHITHRNVFSDLNKWNARDLHKFNKSFTSFFSFPVFFVLDFVFRFATERAHTHIHRYSLLVSPNPCGAFVRGRFSAYRFSFASTQSVKLGRCKDHQTATAAAWFPSTRFWVRWASARELKKIREKQIGFANDEVMPL